MVSSKFILLLFAWISIASAAPPVLDPQGLLNRVDSFLKSETVALNQAYQCKDEAVFDNPVERCNIGCGRDGCASACITQDPAPVVLKSVAECTAEKASVFSDDGKNFEIGAEEFNALHGNLVRPFLRDLPEFLGVQGQVILDGMTEVAFKTVPSDPASVTYSAVNLTGKIQISGFSDGPSFLITLLKDVPAVAQVARFRLDSTTWFRIKSLKRP